MATAKNILVFPCGSEIGLELNRALGHSTHITLLGASSVDNHGRFAFRNYVGDLPMIDDPNFVAALADLIDVHEIDFVIPAMDGVLVRMAEWQECGLLGSATLIAPPVRTCQLVSSKRKTYELLEMRIETPLIYDSIDEIDHYPVFLKPDVGCGSRGTHKAESALDVAFFQSKDPSLLILEYLPGPEYTIDCYSNRHGELKFCGGRLRERVSNGISVRTFGVEDARFTVIAEEIVEALDFTGAWFFQLKERSDGELVLLEIAARIAGASGYHRSLGINLSLLSVLEAMGADVEILENPQPLEMDRALESRYRLEYPFDKVYVDLDETIIEAKALNYSLIAILLKFKGEGKRLYLVTRHETTHSDSVSECLASHHIRESLFEKIIDVGRAEKKSQYIEDKGAIFVDDSFAERREVCVSRGIPVFDVNQFIEVFQ